MKDLFELYLRYDGPVPKERNFTTSPVSWNLMMQQYLRCVRLKRHNAATAYDFDQIVPLCNLIKEIHKQL